MKMRFGKWALAVLVLVAACSLQAGVKYVILIVGDGFGSNQRKLAEKTLKRKLEMSRMPVTVLLGTRNAQGGTTDSAASGTALACGVKTSNGVVGMAPGGKKLESIAMYLKRTRKFRVGLVSSSPLCDATPAVFYAHQPKRSRKKEIAEEALTSGVDFWGGAPLNGDGKFVKRVESAVM